MNFFSQIRYWYLYKIHNCCSERTFCTLSKLHIIWLGNNDLSYVYQECMLLYYSLSQLHSKSCKPRYTQTLLAWLERLRCVTVGQGSSVHLKYICILLIFKGQTLFGGWELLTVLLQLGVLRMHLLQLLGRALIQNLSQSKKEMDESGEIYYTLSITLNY